MLARRDGSMGKVLSLGPQHIVPVNASTGSQRQEGLSHSETVNQTIQPVNSRFNKKAMEDSVDLWPTHTHTCTQRHACMRAHTQAHMHAHTHMHKTVSNYENK